MALTPEQIDKLRGTVHSLGWNEVIKPVLANSGKVAMDMLVDPTIKREGLYEGSSDDALRGVIKAYRTVLTLFEQEVTAYDHNKRLEEVEKQMATDQGQGSPYVDQTSDNSG